MRFNRPVCWIIENSTGMFLVHRSLSQISVCQQKAHAVPEMCFHMRMTSKGLFLNIHLILKFHTEHLHNFVYSLI